MTWPFVLAMATPAQGSPNPWAPLVTLAIVVGIFYFVVAMPMRKRQQKVSEFQANLKVGDQVVTSGGIYGVITKVGDAALQVQIADRVRVDISRSAIVGYQGQEPVAADGGGQS